MIHTEGMLRDDALKGKTIIVTGGGTGLGKSMATYFLKLGANIVICSRRLEVLEKTAKELQESTGGNVLAVECDVRKNEQIENVIAKAIEKFGSVNGLVNNSAGNFISPTERLSYKAVDVVVDIVLRGTYYFTLALGKYWIDNNIKGTVLNISTTYAWTGSGWVVPSAMAKAGVLAMTKSLAFEWADHGIRLNAIAPGPFPTKGAWERLFPEELAKKFSLESRIPLERVGDHQELANLAAYLMSDFSAYMTGEVITLDGGEVLAAGQFNFLKEVTDDQWDAIEDQIKNANRNSKKPE
ncbi:SDR family oxidoreductase [Dyadobacter chenhuakuii]|uniref:SDR family oxidoreductase n=1 Tax=Dyadobacter chenhuakuii TaxID=2909339 RepID=A0A9X1TVR3_9BACT|nr:SDR family oxidoreductase [Dyadobacter chenhuakuii]MCF2493811.1 SDR family oxidoreductase [Dyadobacter chenhuakuii]MCF2500678.1 SDR family oxidoreductase [Dyadobacter chenhuakuii]USJ30944.1 SDR family oxidoreductase [Dyadobacter chenhuakuii]